MARKITEVATRDGPRYRVEGWVTDPDGTPRIRARSLKDPLVAHRFASEGSCSNRSAVAHALRELADQVDTCETEVRRIHISTPERNHDWFSLPEHIAIAIQEILYAAPVFADLLVAEDETDRLVLTNTLAESYVTAIGALGFSNISEVLRYLERVPRHDADQD